MVTASFVNISNISAENRTGKMVTAPLISATSLSPSWSTAKLSVESVTAASLLKNLIIIIAYDVARKQFLVSLQLKRAS